MEHLYYNTVIMVVKLVGVNLIIRVLTFQVLEIMIRVIWYGLTASHS